MLFRSHLACCPITNYGPLITLWWHFSLGTVASLATIDCFAAVNYTLCITTAAVSRARRLIQRGNHTCQPVRVKILEIQFFLNLTSHCSIPLPPMAKMLSYPRSAQRDLTNKLHENIRTPIITALTLNSEN